MSKLLEIKRRVRSIKSLAKVTRAMELVTHTKIGRMRKGALSSRTYQEAFARLMSSIQNAYSNDDSDEYYPNESIEPDESAQGITPSKHEVIVFFSQKGFCGGFNDRLLAHIAREFSALNDKNATSDDIRITVVGRMPHKWGTYIRTAPAAVIAAPDKSWQRDLTSLAKSLTGSVHTARAQKGGGDLCVSFAFNRFSSILDQDPTIQQIWPPVLKQEDIIQKSDFLNAIVEPEPESMMRQLTKPWIEASLARAWWETAIGENYARLLSMKSANDNAGIIIDNLTLQYNKTRQLVITQELSEISSAFNVLNILKEKREQSEV